MTVTSLASALRKLVQPGLRIDGVLKIPLLLNLRCAIELCKDRRDRTERAAAVVVILNDLIERAGEAERDTLELLFAFGKWKLTRAAERRRKVAELHHTSWDSYRHDPLKRILTDLAFRLLQLEGPELEREEKRHATQRELLNRVVDERQKQHRDELRIYELPLENLDQYVISAEDLDRIRRERMEHFDKEGE